MRVSSRSSRSHSSSVCVLPSCVTRGAAIELGGFQHGVDGRIPDCDARCRARRRPCRDCRGPGTRAPRGALRATRRDPRCAGWPALRRWRDCARVSSATAGSRRGRDTGGNRHAAGGLELVLDLAHARERVVGPGLRELLEVHVAIDARQQALGAELGEALIDHASGFAELGIAGVAQREHRVLQLRQLRRTLGAEEFVQRARFIRRIAVAMRADHDVQQLFLRDLARLVVAGLDHARLHAERLHGGQQLLADLAAVAGVRGGDDGERRRARPRRQRAPVRMPRAPQRARAARAPAPTQQIVLEAGNARRRGARRRRRSSPTATSTARGSTRWRAAAADRRRSSGIGKLP